MASNHLLSYAGWYFLPNLVTGWVQTILYSVFIRAGEPKPAPGSPRHTRDRKRIHVTIIAIYLLFTIYEADWQLRRAGDFYSILDVPQDVTEKGINSKYRRLTLQFHPDKRNTASDPTPPGIDPAAYFLSLGTAKDTLVDPAKRFAYDRFGPEILKWQNCKTLRDYVFHGLQQTTLYYGVSFCFLILLGVLGYLREGKYWRYWSMAALLCLEVTIMTRPTWSAFLTGFLNPLLVTTGIRTPYVPFQFISVIRKITVTFFIALNQVAPVLRDPAETTKGGADAGVTEPLLNRLDMLSIQLDQETLRLRSLEMTPFVSGGPQKMKDLKAGLKEWLVSNTIRNDPDVKAAVTKTLTRRRGGDAVERSGDVPPPVPPHLE